MTEYVKVDKRVLHEILMEISELERLVNEQHVPLQAGKLADKK